MSPRPGATALLAWLAAAAGPLCGLTACQAAVLGTASAGTAAARGDSLALLGRWRSTRSGCDGWSAAQYLVQPAGGGGVTIALLASPVCMTRDRPPRGLAVGGALLQLDTMRLLELRATRIPGMGDHHDLGDLSTIGWVRVLATGDTLRLVALDARAVSARLAARPGEVPHRTRGSTIILTGDGEQTVAFLLRAFADPTLVSADTGEFVRVPR